MTGGPDQATTAHLGMDLLAQGAPAVVRAAHSGALGELDRTVESGPGHHLRVGEVALGAADFPDSLVRLAPSLFEDRQHAEDDVGWPSANPFLQTRAYGASAASP